MTEPTDPTDPTGTATAVAVRARLRALVADIEPAPDALTRLLADLPPDRGEHVAPAVVALADPVGPVGPVGTGGPRGAARRRRWLPVAAAGGIAAALVAGIGWAVVAGHDAASTPGPVGSVAPAGTGGVGSSTPVASDPVAPASTAASAASAAAAQQVQAAFAACAAAGVAAIDTDGGAAPGSTVVTGPATGWTAGAHVGGDADRAITIGTAPGGQLAGCGPAGYQYLGVLDGPAGALDSVAAPGAGRAQQLVADNTAAQQGVNLQAGILATDVTRMTVTAAAGVAVEVQVVGHTYALLVGPVPGTTTLADATVHLFDAAGNQTWSGPVE